MSAPSASLIDAPATVSSDAAPPFTLHTAEHIAIESRRMHLLRESEAFEYEATAWLTLVQSANVFGGWTPRGTDAPASVSPFPARAPLFPGHYVPAGQQLDAADARSLAKGIAKALAELPSPGYTWPFREGGCARYFPIHDPRLCPAENMTGGVAPLYEEIIAFDIHKGDGVRIADFLSRGACRLFWGRPAAALLARSVELHQDERQRLKQERGRLVAAIAAGDLTSADARPQLDRIRDRLAVLDGGVGRGAA